MSKKFTITWVCSGCDSIHGEHVDNPLVAAEHVYKLLAQGCTGVTVMDAAIYEEISLDAAELMAGVEDVLSRIEKNREARQSA